MKRIYGPDVIALLGQDTTMKVQINGGVPGVPQTISIFRWDGVEVIISWDVEHQWFLFHETKAIRANPNGNPYNDGKVGFLG